MSGGPGLNPHYGWHQHPLQDWDGYGYPQGWEPVPDMPAPPGMQWVWVDSDIVAGWNNVWGGGGGGWADNWSLGGWPAYSGGPWIGPHGRTFAGPGPNGYTRWSHFGPGPYTEADMASNGVVNDDGIPGINLRNSRGGIGAEPGYDYIYPKEHTKVHVIYSDQPPWHNDGAYHVRCFHVPTMISVKELMQQFGCTSENDSSNALIELNRGNDGRWYRGLTMKGDDKDRMKKSIGELGWNKNRDGVNEQEVWVWFTSNYRPG